MTPADGALDARDQRDATLGGVGGKRCQVELPVVQGDRERVVAQRRCPIDQRPCRMGDPVFRVVRCMRVEFDF